MGDVDSKLTRICEHIINNDALSVLNVAFDEIGSEGVRSVATALKSNTTLTTLNLACNRIDLVGAQLLAEVLKSNTSLTSLNLACKWRNRAESNRF